MRKKTRVRIMAWHAALGIWRAHPVLGAGAGTFLQTAPAYLDPEFYNLGRAQWLGHAHNELLEQAAETGAVGVALALWLLAAFVAMCGQALATAPQRLCRFLAAGALAGMIAFLGQNLAGVSMRWPVGGVYFWVMLAVGAVVALTATYPPTPSLKGGGAGGDGGSRLVQIVLAVLMLGVVAFGGSEIVKRQISDMRLGAAIGDREAHRYKQAYDEATEALLDNPYSLVAYSTLGAIGVDSHNYELARSSFTALQSLSADYPMSNRGLAEAYLGLKRYPEAIAASERDVKLEHSPVSLTSLARVYAEAGRLDDAQRVAEEAVRMVDEGRPWLHLDAAEVYLRHAQIVGQKGDREAARRDLAAAEKLAPKSARPHVVAGELYRSWQQWPEAIRELQQARTLNPQAPQPLVLLGLTYAAQGDWAQAREAYRAALALQPEDPYVSGKLKEAESAGQ